MDKRLLKEVIGKYTAEELEQEVYSEPLKKITFFNGSPGTPIRVESKDEIRCYASSRLAAEDLFLSHTSALKYAKTGRQELGFVWSTTTTPPRKEAE